MPVAAVAEARYAVPAAMGLHRGVVPLNEIERIRGFVTWAIGGRSAPVEDDGEANWSVNFGHLFQEKFLGNPSHVLGFMQKSPIPDLCREILGPDIVYSLDKTLARDYQPSRRPVPAPMHFDAHLFGPHVPMVTVWIPLNDVGRESPGLSIATRPNWPRPLWNQLADGIDKRARYHPFSLERRGYPHEEIYALAEAEPAGLFIEPQLDAGDVMIFDHQFIHGTQTGIPEPTRRMSLEIRMLPAGAAKRVLGYASQHMFVKVD